eukprot:519937-Pleurochrysis_carterae.AAC.1
MSVASEASSPPMLPSSQASWFAACIVCLEGAWVDAGGASAEGEGALTEAVGVKDAASAEGEGALTE